MSPAEIRRAFLLQEMGFYFALRGLMDTGFTEFAAERYLYKE